MASTLQTQDTGLAWRWQVVCLLFLATVLNYLDRQTLAVCAPHIREEFQLNNEGFGTVLSAFRWTYAALMIPAGLLADRVAVRWLYPAAVVVWSLFGAAAGFAGSVRALIWTRVGLAVGESFNWPCALRTTATVLAPAERGLGNGIFQSGTAVGALLAPLLIVPIMTYFGWRTAFISVGALGLAWVVAWLVVTRPAPGRAIDAPRPPSAAGSPSVLHRLRQLFGDPRFWLLVLAAAAINPCLYFVAEWLSNYLYSQRGLSAANAGYATVPVYVGLDLGNICGGGLVLLLARRGWRVRRVRAGVVMAAGAMTLSAIPANAVPSPTLTVTLLVVTAFGIAAIQATWLTCIQEVSPAAVGLAMGLLGAVGAVTGALGNPRIGRYVDNTGHYDLVFLLLAAAPIVTAAAIVAFDGLRPKGDSI
jgi:ACS family hexuronate transporter-like MFS transporter